jgi:4-diphosphocytidyl-2-C-methyl-D-erythritol kinase
VTTAAMFVPAWAKINLTLSVLGKREDGYHALASVMQTISLCDTLHIQPTDDATITCDVDDAMLRSDDNLAIRAARLLQTKGRISRGAALELRKQIPVQGGMGGGSSDAAAALVALNRLWALELSQSRLAELAAQLGSDVPFFIHGGTALVEGRGEIVTQLPDCEPLWLVLAHPPVSVPTAVAFRALRAGDFGDRQDTDRLVAAIRQRAPLPFERFSNALEASVMRQWPEIAQTRDALLQAGAPIVRMSGSGPTLFAPFRALATATAVYESSQSASLRVTLCHTVARSPGIGSPTGHV